ncbi:MAG: PfkB family carbohydrate kinase, partial [Anaerolineae bacterium]
QEGIATQYVSIDPETASGVALIFVDASGENSIAVAPGANARLTPEDVQNAREAIEAADVLLLQLETPLETVRQAAEIAHRAGVRVVLNPAPARPLPVELLALVDVLTPNEGEANLLAAKQVAQSATLADAETAARCLIERGVKVVIVTLGARGALIVTPDFQQLVPGFTVDVIDTTAAGDAFNGGLAVALAEGKTLAEAVLFANACGALAATKLGAQPSLPTAEEVARFLAERH